MDNADLINRFDYHAPNDAAKERHQRARSLFYETARVIDGLCADSREKSLAITALEEAMFWTNAAIARLDDGGLRR